MLYPASSGVTYLNILIIAVSTDVALRPSILHSWGAFEMVVKMVDPLHQPVLNTPRQADKIKCLKTITFETDDVDSDVDEVVDLEVGHHVAEADAASVRTNRNTKLGCHQINCQHLVSLQFNSSVGIQSRQTEFSMRYCQDCV